MLKLKPISDPQSQTESNPVTFLGGSLRPVLEALSQQILKHDSRVLGAGEFDVIFALNPVEKNLTFKNKTYEDLLPQLLECETLVREQLAAEHPEYDSLLIPFELQLRTSEEANRATSPAREDLLHIDAHPNRPTHGKRVLRVSINLDPERERVWATSEQFPELLRRYAILHRLPMHTEDTWTAVSQGWFRSILGERNARTPYDGFMLKLRHFLQNNEKFQEQASRKLWNFSSFSAWATFTDSTAFAQLRGRLALEITYLLPSQATEDSPITHLVKTAIESRLRRAA